MKNWYKEAFTEDYINIYKHRSQTEATITIDQLLHFLNLGTDSLCLDLCCGFGRHLSYLLSRGVNTYGLDLSQPLLENAVEIKKLAGRVILGDMRHLPFNQSFDFVFSFFSSFGYFHQDSENIGVLREIYRVLKSNGRFVIDYLNAEHVRDNLRENDLRCYDDFTVKQKRWINTDLNTVEKELVVEDAKGERSYFESVKLYDLADFNQFCSSLNLKITHAFGDVIGKPFKNTSSRLIMVGEKIDCHDS